MSQKNHTPLQPGPRDQAADRPPATNWQLSTQNAATRAHYESSKAKESMWIEANDCDRTTTEKRGGQQANNQKSCDHSLGPRTLYLIAAGAVLLLALIGQVQPVASQSIIIDHHRPHRLAGSNVTNSEQQPVRVTPFLAAHFQPASLVLAQNKSINFTHVAVDELTSTIYLGATNWLFQVNGRDLRVEQALRTGPTTSDSSLARDCAPADCLNQLVQVDLHELLPLVLHHQHPAMDLSAVTATSLHSMAASARPRFGLGVGATMHTAGVGSGNATGSRIGVGRPTLMQSGLATVTTQLPTTTTTLQGSNNAASSTQQQAPMQLHNNYNKLLAIDQESRSLIVCGSLNQGACRRHQLRNIANFSELIPLPVASNDEHSSTLSLVVKQATQPGVFYVAATNSRLGPYREMVPAISARSLDWSSRDRSMQIIERSFTDLARVDISFELRDYYLVNYVAAFQHNDFVYFATVQRKSPLRQLEESGYTTRLARLCLNDLSFQSYTEMSLECSGPSASGKQVNYNLLQDAHLIMQAGSQLQAQLGSSGPGKSSSSSSSAVLVGAFAQSKDHTTKSQHKSALCLFPMDKIEQKFQENIDLCYNGTIKSRNMNYIAGSVSDCPRPQAAGGQQTSQNYCNEPIKLNGSVALQAEPIASFDQELITSIQSTLAPTSPINIQHTTTAGNAPKPALQSTRQHQVLIAGTAEGRLKRLVLVAAGQRTTALEFDSVSLAAGAYEQQDSAVLADLHLVPGVNPQLNHASGGGGGERHQFALAATAHKLLKVRINACKASRARQQTPTLSDASAGNSSIVDDCLACSQLQDPFCGWCSQSALCTTRDECLQEGWSVQHTSSNAHKSPPPAPAAPIHWTPFDSIRCSNYQPISPKNVPLQADSSSLLVDVNVRLNLRHQQGGANHQHKLAASLARAQFVCHFDYLSQWARSHNNSTSRPVHPAGATTKATQARMNLHAGTVAIGCPLPVVSQRPSSLAGADLDHARVRLSVRLASVGGQHKAHQDQEEEEDRAHLEQVLGMRSGRVGAGSGQDLAQQQVDTQMERELTLYDCSANTDCHSCLSSGLLGRRWACAWCPLSAKCTFNSSHPDFGCAAGAVASTTPHSAALAGDPSLAQIRGSQLTASLDRAQASVLGLTIERPSQCQASPTTITTQRTSTSDTLEDATQLTSGVGEQAPLSSFGAKSGPAVEVLLPNSVRRSVHVALARPIHHFQPREKRVLKLECLLELEGAKARFAARLQDNSLVVCQESHFSYQTEVATQRGQLSVILNDNQVIETIEVIIYKCHLFGVNPPALTSSVFSVAEIAATSSARSHGHHSSAAWASNLSHDFLHLISTSSTSNVVGNGPAQSPPSRRSSDCSLCLNIDRKYQCSWCAGQCKHLEQCGAQELPASTCPPPRIDSIHPTSGPIVGGTLLTIEGSNLGSNEREIQDKISVGGEPCQLIMYSVSTRIVCRTAPTTIGPQAATVFVGNRAGVTSAHEKFHYKAIHLSDVSPRIGPVSGGTRLILSGSNLNVGSRTQVFLDDVPCQLDHTFDMTSSGSSQLACITGPYLLASNSMMHISRLTLVIDNSTHELPFPFTYQPDPIITAIEPAESFLSGGRLLLISGEHLSSPQSVKLVVFHESRPSLSNATSCQKLNDTLVTCLTPGFLRADLLAVGALASQLDADSDQQQQQQSSTNLDQVQMRASGSSSSSSVLAHESGGLKLKMAFLMDDVRSVRNLDEYYHHLPHYLAYYEDPALFRLQPPVLEYREELHLAGENLLLRQLDQDTLITIGAHICTIKSITAQRVVCEPPARIAPIYEQQPEGGGGGGGAGNPLLGARRRITLVERPLLPVVALIGSNLRYELGHMQYSSSQYLPPSNGNGELQPPTELASPSPNYPADFALDPFYSQAGFTSGGGGAIRSQPDSGASSLGPMSALVLGLLGLLVTGLLVALSFALARFRQTKAQQREYKRIQLQMGSLDCQSPGLAGSGASFASGLFDRIYLPSMGLAGSDHHHVMGHQQQQQLFANAGHQPRTATVDYVANHLANGSAATTTTTSKTKPLFQFFTPGQPQVPPNSFPPSPLTDISSLIGSSPAYGQQQQQHLVKLNASGQVVNHMANQHHQQYNYGISLPQPPAQANDSASPSHSSSGSSSGGSSSQQNHRGGGTHRGTHNSSARNFNWTQEAPSTIVPYAVIEACNLTLEGKNAIKEYV